MLRSVSGLSEAMDDPDKAVRLRAARYVMSFAVRICETGKLGKDIQDLEDALSLSDRPNTLLFRRRDNLKSPFPLRRKVRMGVGPAGSTDVKTDETRHQF